MLKINVSTSHKEKYKLCEFLVIMGDKSKASPFINQSGELAEMRFIKMGHILTFPCFDCQKQYFALKYLSSEFYRLRGKSQQDSIWEAFRSKFSQRCSAFLDFDAMQYEPFAFLKLSPCSPLWKRAHEVK